MLIAWMRLVRHDPCQGLIEPSADPVVAVMYMAAFSVPVFPGRGRTVINHIQIARIVTLFQHLEHEVDLLVLDECQTILSSAGRAREDKQKIEQITRIVENIVRQGRSRGMFVLLLTQKPTADSIPTGIRDNCGLRACLRVTTDHAITSTLGDLPDDVSPDVLPTNIPSSRKGGGTLANEAGELKSVRLFYIPEDKQKQLLNSGVV